MFLKETYKIIEDCLYVPKLDGSETIYQVQGTTTVANGSMSGGSGYLTKGFDNTGNWQIEAEIYLENYSGFWITPTTETTRDSNQLNIIVTRMYAYLNGQYTLSPTYTSIRNTWKSVVVKKNGSTISITIGNETVSVNWSVGQTAPKLSVGVDSWGGTSTIKNIKVKPL